MAEYIITCPICRKKYKLTPKNPSTLSQKTFSCPNCNYSAPFSSLIPEIGGQIVEQNGLNSQKTSQLPHNPTKVAQNKNMQANVYLTVIGYNSRFVLTPGIYVLGRKSSDSTASLQLAPDISM